MTIIRANTVFQGESGLPEDQFVNTFHFDTGIFTYESSAPIIAAALIEFWTVDVPITLLSMDAYLSSCLLTAANIVTYDLSDLEPRPPTAFPFTIAPNQQTDPNLPEEVSLCLSIHGAPPITARRRGRIYVGPFCSRISDESAGVSPRPTAAARNVFGEAATRLLNGTTGGGDWVIRSTVPSVNYVPVVGGWIDNAWDTQRRRGVDPTTRTIWPNPA